MGITDGRAEWNRWLDLGVLLGCALLSYLKPVPFPWKVPLIAAIILLYCFIRYGNPSMLGLGRTSWSATLLWGVAVATIIVVGISNLLNPLLEHLLNEPVDTSAYGALEGNTPFLMDYWWKAMISAAISEEIFYRGFAFFVFERFFGKDWISRILIVAGMAVYFGLSHAFQGPVGVLGITAAALVFGSAYYLSNKNLWAMMLAHALLDSWSLFSLHQGGIRFFFDG